MKKALLFLFFMALAGAITWYEMRPTTVTVPVAAESDPYMPSFEDETYVPPMEETTTTMAAEMPPPDFTAIDVHLAVHGRDGDDVLLEEAIQAPQTIGELPQAVQEAFDSCLEISDRDMAVRVNVRLTLNSDLPADVEVDYSTGGLQTIFDFSDGLTCKSDGDVKHSMQPGQQNIMSYWVLLRGMITPDAPRGDMSKSWYIGGPVMTLPNLQLLTWQLWGEAVTGCDGLFGDIGRITLAGLPAYEQADCDPASTPEEALGNM